MFKPNIKPSRTIPVQTVTLNLHVSQVNFNGRDPKVYISTLKYVFNVVELKTSLGNVKANVDCSEMNLLSFCHGFHSQDLASSILAPSECCATLSLCGILSVLLEG